MYVVSVATSYVAYTLAGHLEPMVLGPSPGFEDFQSREGAAWRSEVQETG